MRKRPSRSTTRPSRPRPNRPRRRKRYKINYKRLAMSLMVLLLVVVLSIALFKTQYFYVTKVNVRGNVTIPYNDIVSRLSMSPDTNIFLINKGAIIKQVRANPVVSSAELFRKLPDTLLICITERKPAFTLATGSALYLVDAGGVPFRVAKQIRPNIPCIYFKTPRPPVLGRPIMLKPFRAAMQSAALARAEGIADVRKITVDQNHDLCLNVRDGFLIKLGRPERLPEKLKKAAIAVQRMPGFRQRGEYVDLSCPEAPALKLRESDTP